jgi:hypothetical protein
MKYAFILLYFFVSTGVWIQGFALFKQDLYHLSHTLILISFSLFFW